MNVNDLDLKKTGVLFRNMQRERPADESIARRSEKFHRRSVDLFDVADAVEAYVRDWRKLKKIDITLNRRLQFRFRMLEDPPGRIADWSASFGGDSFGPIAGKNSRRLGQCFSLLHRRSNKFARR